MSRINRLPLGLLDFLGTKSLGDNPSELLGQVRPTLELGGFFSAEKLELVFDAVNQDTISNSQFITVPTGEVWVLLAAYYKYVITVGGNISDLEIVLKDTASGAVLGGGGGPEFVLASNPARVKSQNPVANTRLLVTYKNDAGLVLTSDTQIGGRFRNRNTTASEVFEFAAMIRRYKV